MNIVYTENPLCSRVELNESESNNFRATIKMAELESLLLDAHVCMQADEYHDVDAARRAVDPDYYMNDDDGTPSKLDQRVDVLYNHYTKELSSSHGGDCTCFASSCSKCQAEVMLHIDTTPGLGRHSAHYIFETFSKKDVTTCGHAIALLQNTQDLSETGKSALEWLIHYQETKLTPIPR
jgi:hypothetical protein